MFGTFLSLLGHCFGSAGIVTPPKGKIAHSENLKVWTDIWADLDIRVVSYRFAILEWSLAKLIFLGQTVVVQHTVFPPHRLPLFPFLCEMLKFEGSLGKFVWRWKFTYLCQKINVYGKFMGVVNSRLREWTTNWLGS